MSIARYVVAAACMSYGSALVYGQNCLVPPGAVRVDDNYQLSPTGNWWLIDNWRDTGSSIGKYDESDYYNFKLLNGTKLWIADPFIMRMERTAVPGEFWYYISGTNDGFNLPIYRTRDFVQFQTHMTSFDNSNRNGSNQERVAGGMRIGPVTYNQVWAGSMMMDPDAGGGNPPIHMSFTARDSRTTRPDDHTLYHVAISKQNFESWHSMPSGSDGPRFGDYRYAFPGVNWFGYEINGVGTGWRYDGGHAKNRAIPTTAPWQNKGPACGQLMEREWGLLHRCMGSITAMYLESFFFVDPQKAPGASWRQVFLYTWCDKDASISREHWGQHVAAASISVSPPRMSESTDILAMGFAKNQYNGEFTTRIDGTPGYVDNGSLDSNGNENSFASWAEGVAAFYNENNNRYYVLYSRNRFDGPSYQIVYRKTQAGQPFTSLAMTYWADKTVLERVLISGSPGTSVDAYANNFGHGEVFWIRDHASNKKAYYLVCHATLDDLDGNLATEPKRTVFFKELTFDPVTGDIVQLCECSNDPRSDVNKFRIPVCRD